MDERERTNAAKAARNALSVFDGPGEREGLASHIEALIVALGHLYASEKLDKLFPAALQAAANRWQKDRYEGGAVITWKMVPSSAPPKGGQVVKD